MKYNNPRLSPKRTGSRYYHLLQLRKAYEQVIASYMSASEKIKLLDYGCGTKPYKQLLDGKNIEYIGADFPSVSDRDIDLCDKGTLQGVSDGAFDTVLSSQVLEHVTDVDLYLKESRRVLKNDGTLILSTHGYWMYHPDPTDFWRWTRDGLVKTIERNGFKVVECKGVMGLAASGLQLFQDGIRPRIPAVLRGLFFVTIAFLQKLVDGKPKNHIDACVYVVVAKAC